MNHADFGRYLSQQRELRSLSKEEVAERTKIPLTVISALEEGQAARLPGRVFVVNYIRAYAQVIGLSPQDAILRFEEVDLGQTMPSPVTLERKRRKRSWLILVAVGVAVVLGIAALALLAGPGAGAPAPLPPGP